MRPFKSKYVMATALATSLVAGGCADDTFDSVKGSYDTDREITLILNLPPFTEAGTRAVADEDILDARIYYLTGQTEIGTEDLTYNVGDQLVYENNKPSVRKVIVTVPAGADNIRIVANHTTNGVAGDEMTYDPNDKNQLVFYGETTVSNLEQGNKDIDLYRSCAKTTFKNSVTDMLQIEEYHFYGMPSKGMVSYGSGEDKQHLPASGLTYATTAVSVTQADMASATKYNNSFYHYEAAAKECYWIIKAKYDGHSSSYYKVAYIEKDDKTVDERTDNDTELPILRNHRYDFDIIGVSSDGYATEGEAKAAAPDNRLQVLMKNSSENIFNMVACRDYYLGVPSEVIAVSAGGSVGFEVITNHTLEDDAIPVTAEFADGGADWATGINVTESATSTDNLTDGKMYKVSFTLSPNNESSEERYVTVRVRVGDLSQDVRITQLGNDFLYGTGRWMVGIANMAAQYSAAERSEFTQYQLSQSSYSSWNLPSTLKSADTYDYFKILENVVTGETAAESGADRGDGLHFSVYVDNPDDQFIYRIPKSSGDTAEILDDDGNYTCTDKGDYWEIACSSTGNENYKLWHGRLLLKHYQQQVIYEIYHVGLFHKLTDVLQNNNPEGQKISGWFYYEQVNVADPQGGSEPYHILDRNIGASTNKFYSPASTFSRENTGARGAYFHVEEIAGMGKVEALLPKGFNQLPSKYHFIKLPPTIISAADVQSGWVTCGGLQSWIYLPVAGTMDGENLVEEMHAQIWSGSMVEGIQGFYEGEQDYGLWYRILDMYGTATVPTVRIKNRATQELRGIPIRAMKCPPAVPGVDLPDVAHGRSRIILSNDANWSEAYMKCWGNYEETLAMVKGDDAGTWYYADLKGQPTNVYFSGSNRKTGNFSVTFADGVARFSNADDQNDPNPIKLVGTIYFKENPGQVPQNGGSNVYIRYYGGTNGIGENDHKLMTLEIINGERWWKYENIPLDNTNLIFCSYRDSGSYISGNYGSLKSDFETYGNTLYYYLDNWNIVRRNAPSSGGETYTSFPTGNYRVTTDDSNGFLIWVWTNKNEAISADKGEVWDKSRWKVTPSAPYNFSISTEGATVLTIQKDGNNNEINISDFASKFTKDGDTWVIKM